MREGAVLFENVGAFFREQPLTPFRPQKFCLTLLNTADGTAVFSYGPFARKGRWERRLKDRIDRAWIDKFTRFAPMTETGGAEGESPLMRCGGCGSKISSDVLSAVLRRIEVTSDPRILLGCQAGEDAAVSRFRPDMFGSRPEKLVEVQTVDFFKSFVDDPFLFGRIAALHAVSDLYAMNARPFSALAVVTLPYARGPIQEAQLFELLSGCGSDLPGNGRCPDGRPHHRRQRAGHRFRRDRARGGRSAFPEKPASGRRSARAYQTAGKRGLTGRLDARGLPGGVVREADRGRCCYPMDRRARFSIGPA